MPSMLRPILAIAAALAVFCPPGARAGDGTTPPKLKYRSVTAFTEHRDAVLPSSRLIEALDGMLYGTTYDGGRYGCGALFRIKPPSGARVTAQLFDCSHGRPSGALVQGPGGHLYGTTVSVGLGLNVAGVYRIRRDGRFEWLHTFESPMGDYGNSELVVGPDGLLYGMTGGPNWGGTELGTIYRIDAQGRIEVLHRFDEPAARNTGLYLNGPFLLAADGMLYASAGFGGERNTGMIFRWGPRGFERLYSFPYNTYDPPLCNHPAGPLAQGADGAFYGTCPHASENGLVFRWSAEGGYATVRLLTNLEGWEPGGGLVTGADGAFYGVAPKGGLHNAGTLFRVEPSGRTQVLHHFGRPGDGIMPTGTPLFASDGALYGGTYWGGEFGLGMIYRLSERPPAAPAP